jgi:hypothetical protein
MDMDTIAGTHDFGNGEQTKHHVTSLGEQVKDNLRRGCYSLIKQRASATVFRWQDVPRGGEDGVASYGQVFVMWFLGSDQLGGLSSLLSYLHASFTILLRLLGDKP